MKKGWVNRRDGTKSIMEFIGGRIICRYEEESVDQAIVGVQRFVSQIRERYKSSFHIVDNTHVPMDAKKMQKAQQVSRRAKGSIIIYGRNPDTNAFFRSATLNNASKCMANAYIPPEMKNKVEIRHCEYHVLLLVDGRYMLCAYDLDDADIRGLHNWISEFDKDEACPVCFEPLFDEDSNRSFRKLFHCPTCSKMICHRCAKVLVSKRNQCPLCRSQYYPTLLPRNNL